MTVLTSAVVLVGALGALNLLLTFGVIRRLRQDAGSGSRLDDAELSASMAPVGTPVADTAAGDTVIEWRGETLVGFFLPDCGPCEEQLPDFIAYARTRERVVAVVLDLAGNATELVGKLERIAKVVVEDGPDGALQTAFQVKALPRFYTVRDGVISANGLSVRHLAERATQVPA